MLRADGKRVNMHDLLKVCILKQMLLNFIEGDHVLLESEDFSKISKPQCITVRTVGACDEESCDSLPAFIPLRLLHELIANSVQQENTTVRF